MAKTARTKTKHKEEPVEDSNSGKSIKPTVDKERIKEIAGVGLFIVAAIAFITWRYNDLNNSVYCREGAEFQSTKTADGSASGYEKYVESDNPFGVGNVEIVLEKDGLVWGEGCHEFSDKSYYKRLRYMFW